MDHQDNEDEILAKRDAERFAETVSQAGSALRQVVDLLREEQSRQDLRDTSARRDAAGRVGIWEARSPNTFVRSPERSAEFSRWADVETIRRDPDKRCVVLLGESVARGYLYDPAYTPALVLQHILDAHTAARPTQVIDLARTSLDSRGLVELLWQSRALSPDVVVIFAGNNWGWENAPITLRQRRSAATALSEGGLPGYVQWLEGNLAAIADGCAARVEEYARSLNIPVVAVVPEFNLADWRPAEETVVSWASNAEPMEWSSCYRAAMNACRSGDWTLAEQLAERMLVMDGRSAPAGLSILAECICRREGKRGLRTVLEQLRDCQVWTAAQDTPRNSRVVVERLRLMAHASGVRVVDLPALFQRWLGDDIPDGRLFLDYCHLTSTGIRVAMAAVAGEVVAASGGRLDFEQAVKIAPLPSQRVEAEAHLAAAIHSAHWGQSQDIVSSHCRQAIEASPAISVTMLDYLEVQACNAPSWLAGNEWLKTCSSAFGRYVVDTLQPHAVKPFDSLLLNAMAEALEHSGVTDAMARLVARRCADYGLRPGRAVDLLHDAQARSWNHPDWSPRGRRRYFYVAYGQVSQFHLVYVDGERLRLTLTARSASTIADVCCELLLGGNLIERVTLSRSWCTHTIDVTGVRLVAGEHEILLRWAFEAPPVDVSIADAVQRLDVGEIPDLMQAYGEVFTFRADVLDGRAHVSVRDPQES